MLQFDTIIIGAGISGLYQLHKCRDELNLKTLAIEEGSDIGGTWYWNRYPGARCDSESHTYGYTFSEKIYKNWTWKEKFPKQNTILKYLKFVEKKLNLRKNITVIRNLDIDNNKVSAGQSIFSLKLSADYALSKNFSAIFFYDHLFSKYEISTAFPQTNIRSGFTFRYTFGN